ncbi:MAG: histidine phosphatase family protein [Mucilaginibacter polytrichastri]|nr:histidine phosphatase family protein [Mucilaginibacter polytrichastri]
MKKLMLIRHAKSDWSHAGLSDYDRPLNDRGKRNAPEMAERLKSRGIVPEHIVSSGAERARTTALIFAGEMGIADIDFDERIYRASEYDLLKVVNGLPDELSFVAIFGHNPTVTELVNHLTGSDIVNMPTCGLALVDIPLDNWAEVSAGTGDLSLYDYPKNDPDI